MATTNLTVSLWRGSQVPPTIYHKWIKLDGDGNYLGQFIYRNGEWVSDLAETEANITQQITDVYETIENVQEGLQTNIDNLESKHDSDKQDLTELINAETDRATAAESNLDSKIVEETDRATKAEAALDTKIQEETLRAEQAEEQLQHNINTVSETITNHIANKENPHEVTKEQVGLGNVTNDAQVKRTEMGQPKGVATLDNNGKIPSTQLNGQLAHVFGVDGVATSTTLPELGVETGDIYWTTDNLKFYNYNGTTWDAPMDPKDDTIYNFRNCDKDGDITRKNILYRWDGKGLTEISESLALGETVGTAYEGNKGAENRAALESLPDKIVTGISTETTENSFNFKVSKVDKTGLNYGEVTEESTALPTATLTTAGLMTASDKVAIEQTFPTKLSQIDNYTVNGKKVSTNPVIAGDNILLDNYVLGTSTEQIIPSDSVNTALAKLQLQVNNNLTSANENLQDHLLDKDNPHEVTKAQVGLGNVDNTSDLDKPISTATQNALDTKQPNLVSGQNIKTINSVSVVGSGDIDFKTINGQELTGTGTIDFRPIQDVNGVEQQPYGTDPIVTLKDAEDAKIYGRSNGSWIDLTSYLTWYVE